MRNVKAVIQCDACKRSISYGGTGGVSIKDAIEIARDRYGWAIGSGPQGRDLCLDDRVRPIKFHDFVDDESGWHIRCAECGRYKSNPAHHEQEVLENAASLQARFFIEWSRR